MNDKEFLKYLLGTIGIIATIYFESILAFILLVR